MCQNLAALSTGGRGREDELLFVSFVATNTWFHRGQHLLASLFSFSRTTGEREARLLSCSQRHPHHRGLRIVTYTSSSVSSLLVSWQNGDSLSCCCWEFSPLFSRSFPATLTSLLTSCLVNRLTRSTYQIGRGGESDGAIVCCTREGGD